MGAWRGVSGPAGGGGALLGHTGPYRALTGLSGVDRAVLGLHWGAGPVLRCIEALLGRTGCIWGRFRGCGGIWGLPGICCDILGCPGRDWGLPRAPLRATRGLLGQYRPLLGPTGPHWEQWQLLTPPPLPKAAQLYGNTGPGVTAGVTASPVTVRLCVLSFRPPPLFFSSASPGLAAAFAPAEPPADRLHAQPQTLASVPGMTSGTGSSASTVAGAAPHNGENKPPQAIVKPQILTHVIEGFVIQEGAEPFPVTYPLPPRPLFYFCSWGWDFGGVSGVAPTGVFPSQVGRSSLLVGNLKKKYAQELLAEKLPQQDNTTTTDSEMEEPYLQGSARPP